MRERSAKSARQCNGWMCDNLHPLGSVLHPASTQESRVDSHSKEPPEPDAVQTKQTFAPRLRFGQTLDDADSESSTKHASCVSALQRPSDQSSRDERMEPAWPPDQQRREGHTHSRSYDRHSQEEGQRSREGHYQAESACVGRIQNGPCIRKIIS
jgi:hypothetical protein